MNIQIIKANGEKVTFDAQKLIHSMHRAGIPPALQQQALNNLQPSLYPGISTKEIYTKLYQFLEQNNKTLAAKYSLKGAIMALGPTGFPFEKFIAKLYATQGYQTVTNLTLDGECISHETDVIITRGNEKIIIEAKFHNQAGTRTDAKTMMYVWSRYEDLKNKHNLTAICLATNTKTTNDATQFALCKGMSILSWDYPKGHSLPELIEQAKLHPITECANLNRQDLQQLVQAGIVLCSDAAILNPKDITNQTSIPEKKLEQIKELAIKIIA